VPGPLVEVPVVFDGPDLEEVAGLTGRTPAALVDELLATELAVAFGGFAPGFAYLSGLPGHLHVPRRATPRTRVPAGAVALAGPFAGIYPTASPGGWQLVGRTDAVLFDVGREPPALLRPGARVRFVPC
jgi:KipI family sensor histidine kinase inhibitor